MKYISNNFIKYLISSVSIVKIISLKINLKKIGNRYLSICPFHNEKNPSFLVNEDKNYYYCFGCKIYGNVIDFVMRYDNISFLESIKKISEMYNIKLLFINKNKKKVNKLNIYLKLMYKFAFYYHNYLLKNEKLFFIREVLFNRGLNINIIKKFFIGYLPKKIINNNNFFKEIELNFFLKFKLIYKVNNIYYNILYNRIIFPIFNIYNKIIGFGGRSLNKEHFPKYLNISNNQYFNKKYILYGFNFLRKKCLKLKKILVVEGYFDVIILHKYNIYYSVALLGSNICNKQIEFLYLYTNNIIFCYDGDYSGIDATKRTLLLILNYINGIKNCYFIILPFNEDPNSLINKEGIIKFKNRINNSKSWYNILYYFFLYKKNLIYLNEKIYFAKKIISYIKIIKSPIIKYFLYNKLSNVIGLSKNKLLNLVNYVYNIKIYKEYNILRYLISILLKYKYLCLYVNIKDKLFNNNKNTLSLFIKIVNICLYNINIDIKDIIKHFSNYRIKFYIEYLYLNNLLIILNNEKKVFLNFLNKLKLFLINKRINLIYLKSIKYGWNYKRKKKIWDLIKFKCLNF